MEFPELGVRCTVNTCKQNDFLPFSCEHCQSIYCKNHFQPLSHNCSKFLDNSVEKGTERVAPNFPCSQESCNDKSPVEILCTECKLHYCVAHRYHGCSEMSEKDRLKKLKKWQRPKAEFEIAKRAVNEEVKEALKKSKNVAMANKVQLMRLKGKATGAKSIPTTSRRYFLVYPPKTLTSKREPKPIFVNVDWTIGKVTDTFSKEFNIYNANNDATAEKLRLFHHSTGILVAKQMDANLLDLMNDNILTDGQSLILEYSNVDEIDSSTYN